jgi:hypothetical protein
MPNGKDGTKLPDKVSGVYLELGNEKVECPLVVLL